MANLKKYQYVPANGEHCIYYLIKCTYLINDVECFDGL